MTEKQTAIEALDSMSQNTLAHAKRHGGKELLKRTEGEIETIRAALQSKPVDVDARKQLDTAARAYAEWTFKRRVKQEIGSLHYDIIDNVLECYLEDTYGEDWFKNPPLPQPPEDTE